MTPIFAFTLAPTTLAIAVLAVIVVALVARDLVRWLFKVDDKLEEMHRLFAELNTLLTQHNMPHLAKVAEAFSVGDISGAVGEIKLLVKQLKDPKQAAAMLDTMFAAELPARLNSVVGRALVLKTVGDWAIANPQLVKAAGLAITLIA